MQKFKYANNKEFLEAFGEKLAEAQQMYAKRQLSVVQIMRIYISIAECKRVVYSDDYEEILFPDYKTQKYVSGAEAIRKIVSLVGQMFFLNARASDADLRTLIQGDFCHDETVLQAIPAPSNLLSMKDGKIYDMFKQDYVAYDPTLHYDMSYDVDPLADIDTSSNYYQAVNLLLESWGQYDKNRIKHLKLVTYLALLGYGAESIIFLIGEGGNGKSTFIRMLSKLVSNKFSQALELHHIGKDDKFALVKPTTRLMYGTELPVGYIFNKTATSRLKALAVSEDVQVSIKYKDAASYSNDGLKIQATNSLPSFEADLGAPIDDRLLVLDFGSVNHRNVSPIQEKISKLTGKSISDLVSDKNFLDMLALIALKEFKFSSKLEVLNYVRSIRASLRSDYARLQNVNGDAITSFFNTLVKEGLFTQPYVPMVFLLNEFLKDNSMYKIEKRGFYTRIQALLASHGLEMSSKRVTPLSLKLHECNVREFLGGEDVSQCPRYSKEYEVLRTKTYSVYNPNATSLLYTLSQKFSELQLKHIMSTLAICENIDIDQLYQYSQSQLSDIYEKHKDSINMYDLPNM